MNQYLLINSHFFCKLFIFIFFVFIEKDPNTINMNEIDIDKPLDQCESLLEFLLILLSKNLNLKPKQVNFKLKYNIQIKNIKMKAT